MHLHLSCEELERCPEGVKYIFRWQNGKGIFPTEAELVDIAKSVRPGTSVKRVRDADTSLILLLPKDFTLRDRRILTSRIASASREK